MDTVVHLYALSTIPWNLRKENGISSPANLICYQNENLTIALVYGV